MKIALLGATGTTGSKVLEQAITRGHSVTALVHGAGRIQSSQRLSVINGSATDSQAVETAVPGADVVVVVVNAMMNKQGLSFHHDVAQTVVSRIKAVNPSARLLMQTSASHGLAGFEKHAGVFMTKVMGFMIDHVIADHRSAENVLRTESEWLHYTVICPSVIVDAPPVGGLVVEPERFPPGNFTITYADLGKLIVDIAETGMYDRMVLGVNGSLTPKNAKRSPKEQLHLLWENIRVKFLGFGWRE